MAAGQSTEGPPACTRSGRERCTAAAAVSAPRGGARLPRMAVTRLSPKGLACAAARGGCSAAGRGGSSAGRLPVRDVALGGQGPPDPALPRLRLRPLLALVDLAGVCRRLVAVAAGGRRPHCRGRIP
ncbi:hypothetical protein C2845_PM12G26450 [Panicum miliaceum]|uniref:Uncharacterized protein n=1 Tax=Panicum miliaceum TaxID=4540 RepID=A0A3L6QHM0_PANMI|nr:hypothetical protein C2845_PM12G26450 [Panicum miliaceum]